MESISFQYVYEGIPFLNEDQEEILQHHVQSQEEGVDRWEQWISFYSLYHINYTATHSTGINTVIAAR